MKRVLLLLLACKGGGPIPDLPANNLGSCVYINGFSKGEECRDYLGDWTQKAAEDDCSTELRLGVACDYEETLGICVLGEKGKFTRITMKGNDPSKCGGAKRGCEFFGGGAFGPSPLCGGASEDVVLGVTFQQPIRVCVDPKAGEPAGQSEGGKVCTWEMISGVTEEGRDFGDYADCDRVRTQRPYYAAPTEVDAEKADPRLNDPEYATELAWLKTQVKAAACVCCHSSRAPQGTSNWYLESPGNFLNSFYGSGLAMGAGWINSEGFGTYPAEENNGFSRPTKERPNDSIFPTTDNARMVRIFERELAHRGLTRADFADQPYAAGPLDEQRFFRPSVCEDGEGVGSNGAVSWKGGRARYMYVLEAEADSPTVPPNLDLPAGTLWRIDVPPEGMGIRSAVYGETPEGLIERVPATPLVSGREYYLYVLADVAIPLTRCLFVAP